MVELLTSNLRSCLCLLKEMLEKAKVISPLRSSLLSKVSGKKKYKETGQKYILVIYVYRVLAGADWSFIGAGETFCATLERERESEARL